MRHTHGKKKSSFPEAESFTLGVPVEGHRAGHRRRPEPRRRQTGKMMADTAIPVGTQKRQKFTGRQAPVGCASCSVRRPGWFCSLGNAVLADLELATSTISLPAQASLFTQGEEARCLYLICAGYLKLTAGRPQ